MITPVSNVWLFPGQGSQEVGMGRALFNIHPDTHRVFEKAESLSGLPLKTVCQRGPEAELVLTNYLQPTLVALSVAFVDFLKMHGQSPTIVAGHSLGELSALYAAEVISQDDVLRLAVERGRLMSQSARGGMMAVKGLPYSVVETVLSSHEVGVLVPANFNTPQQVVLSGDVEALDAIAHELTAQGGTCIRLNVQGAWHSPLVAPAANAFELEIDKAEFHPPKCAFYMGSTAELESDPVRIRGLLKQQICSPVRWSKLIENILKIGSHRYLEVGAGKVLKGLMRGIVENVDSYEILGVDNSRFLKDIAAAGKK